MNIADAVEISNIARVEKSWGMEYWIINTNLYCMKVIECKDGKWSSGGRYHYHMNKDETFLVVTGTLILDVDKMIYKMNPGDKVRITPGQFHRFKCDNFFCRFIEVSTHHDDCDSYYFEAP